MEARSTWRGVVYVDRVGKDGKCVYTDLRQSVSEFARFAFCSRDTNTINEFHTCISLFSHTAQPVLTNHVYDPNPGDRPQIPKQKINREQSYRPSPPSDNGQQDADADASKERVDDRKRITTKPTTTTTKVTVDSPTEEKEKEHHNRQGAMARCRDQDHRQKEQACSGTPTLLHGIGIWCTCGFHQQSVTALISWNGLMYVYALSPCSVFALDEVVVFLIGSDCDVTSDFPRNTLAADVHVFGCKSVS